MVTSLTTLGTGGGPIPSPNRSRIATLVEVAGVGYLFDCGAGTANQLARARVGIDSIRSIFLTHHHPDHTLDVAAVLGAAEYWLGWSESRQTWSIIGPRGTKEIVRAAKDFFAFPYRIFAAGSVKRAEDYEPYQCTEIDHEGEIYRDDLIRVTARENSHYDLLDPGIRPDSKSYSYRVETPDGVVALTGDTGPCPALVPFFQSADVLVSEAMDVPRMHTLLDRLVADGLFPSERVNARKMHMSHAHLDLDEVGRLANDSATASVILTHLGTEVEGVDDTDLESKVLQRFRGAVFAARDLDEFRLDSGVLARVNRTTARNDATAPPTTIQGDHAPTRL